jgi:hypothetical protein
LPGFGVPSLDIEKHLRRSEVKAAPAQVWLALARELGSQGDRYGHPAPDRNLQVQQQTDYYRSAI